MIYRLSIALKKIQYMYIQIKSQCDMILVQQNVLQTIMVKSGSGKINPIRMDPIRTGASYPALHHQCCEIYKKNLREFATAMLNKRTSAARPSLSREICIDHPYSEKFLSTIPIPKRKKMKHRPIYPGIVHPYPKD